EAALDAPERDRLLITRHLGSGLARDVARLERSLLVPDPDRARIVLVLRLRHERQPPAGFEGRVVDVPGPKGGARDRHDLHPRVLPANRLAGRSVTQVVAGRAALEPDTQPFG